MYPSLFCVRAVHPVLPVVNLGRRSHNLVRYRIEFGGLPSFTPRARAGGTAGSVNGGFTFGLAQGSAALRDPLGGVLFSARAPGGGFNSLIVSGPN